MHIIFSDIDYTIVFDRKLHPDTEQVIRRLRRHAYFILVTARSEPECANLPPIPSDALIVENGAGFHYSLEGRRELDRRWDDMMAGYRPTIDRFADQLARRGWHVIKKRRSLSSGIDVSGMADADIRWVENHLPEGLQLNYSRSTHGRYIEVFPIEAGKDKAVHRVCDKLDTPVENTYGLGDNSNDLEMLRAVGQALAPANCHPDVRHLINQRGGYISPFEGHQGAQDILGKVLAALSH